MTAQFQYTIQYRTVLIISRLLLPPDKHHISDDVYWISRGGLMLDCERWCIKLCGRHDPGIATWRLHDVAPVVLGCL